jgi:hypothetical protein
MLTLRGAGEICARIRAFTMETVQPNTSSPSATLIEVHLRRVLRSYAR